MIIWLISELFYPNESATAYILTEMAKKFTQRYDVNVICADTNYEGDAKRLNDVDSHLEGVTIERVKVPELDKNNIVKRLVRFASVSVKLYKKAKEKVQPEDVVFAVTNPAFLLLYMMRLKRRKEVKYILLVHDVFPENALASGVMKLKFLYAFLKKRFDKAYAAADKILVLGEDMKEVITAKTGCSDNVFVCENWGAADIVPSERQKDGKVVLQYAGNIGRVQGLEELLEITSKVGNKQLIFDFWGSGALVPYLNDFTARHQMTNLRVRGSYNRSTQNQVLNDCDIAVISLAKGMKGLGVPSKTYNILAAGKPILYIGDEGSEIYNLVNHFDLGWTFHWDQKTELTKWLDSLSTDCLKEFEEKGSHSRKCYECYYTQEIILDKTLELITK